MANVKQKWQVVATLGEFGDFEEKTGGDLESTITPYYPAGAKTPEKLEGTHDVTDLVLTRAYDPARDAKLIDWVKKALRTGKDNTRNCVVKYLNSFGVVERTETYGTSKVKTLKTPEGKSGDSSPSMLVLTLAVEDNP